MTPNRVSSLVLPLLAGVIVSAAPAWGQVLTGRALDSATAAPLSGVLLLLVDTGDVDAGRALTEVNGSYRIAARPGRYRVRALRIGFRPYTSDWLELLPGQSVSRDVLVASLPIRLSAVQVVAQAPCRRLDERESALVVWQQARTAILAAQLTAQSSGYDATMVLYESFRTPDLRDVISYSARLRTGHALRPWITLSTDSIRRFGYVLTREDGTATYYAPDLELLLSDEFVADHCFRLVRDTATARIGVAFEPTRERTVAEVRGTVWLDEATARLDELRFDFVNLPADVERARPGGDVRFTRLANGGWTLVAWEIRIPVLERRRVRGISHHGQPTSGTGYESSVAEYQSAGGRLVLVRHGMDTVFVGRRSALAGSVVDSASGDGVRGARVFLPELDVAVMTDRRGRFTAPELLPGVYEALVTGPDSVEYRASLAFAGDDVPVTVRIPRRRGPVPGLRDAALFADVRSTDGRILPGAQVFIPALGRSAIADEHGRSRIAGLQPGVWRVVARRLGHAPLDTVVKLASRDTLWVTLLMSAAPTRLDTVEITAEEQAGGLPEFAARRARGDGSFIDDAELRRQEHRGFTDILRSRLQGIGVVTTSNGQHVFKRGASAPGSLLRGARCYVQVVIDGATVFRTELGGKSEPFDWSAIDPRNFAAVEYYADPSITPVEYRSAGAICGTIILWSRR
jgi:hypothetical protein